MNVPKDKDVCRALLKVGVLAHRLMERIPEAQRSTTETAFKMFYASLNSQLCAAEKKGKRK